VRYGASTRLSVMTPSPTPFVLEGGVLAGPALVVHGGAGTFERLAIDGTRARLEDALQDALASGWEVLGKSGAALAAVVEAVTSLEDSGLFNAGRGSSPTTQGRTEMDASVMDGASGAAGAVCATTWPANPIKAALAVADQVAAGATFDGAAWPPLLLAGDGADQVARTAGLPSMASLQPAGPVAPGNRRAEQGGAEPGSHGTVGAVALDTRGHVAAATSTGGREGQAPGRVGDSPIIGAGTWADDTTAAVSATGAGEAFILAGFAHRVDWAMRSGVALDHALTSALAAVSHYKGSGGAIAITASGRFAAIFGTAAMARGWKSADGVVVRV
jgi:L-asparaginase / beta-aspartyl-peptidase